MRILISGAGALATHALVTFLKSHGYWVRGMDVKYPEFSEVDAAEFELVGWCAKGRSGEQGSFGQRVQARRNLKSLRG